MACERLRMCGLGSSGDPVCAKATTAMAVAAETKPKQIAIRINLLRAVGMTQTGALRQLREYIAIEAVDQFQKHRILIRRDSMRFLLVPQRGARARDPGPSPPVLRTVDPGALKVQRQ